MQGEIDGKNVHAKEDTFEVVREQPNIYRLGSGVLVTVKTSVAKIGRQIDEGGSFKENQYGDPAVLVRYAVEIITSTETDDAAKQA